MKKPLHTPGPWRDEGNGDIQGIEDNGYGRGPVDVCSVYLRTAPGRTEANTRLIAAAPDLLEALQDLVEILDMALMVGIPTLPRGADGPAVKARAAIAKATGAA